MIGSFPEFSEVKLLFGRWSMLRLHDASFAISSNALRLTLSLPVAEFHLKQYIHCYFFRSSNFM